MSDLQTLQEDLYELEFAYAQLHRKSNLDYIAPRIAQLKQQIEILTPKKQEEQEQQPQKVPEKNKDETAYIGITKYAWDQEGKKVKIFINLEKIGELDKNNIQSSFTNQSLDVKIHNYNGANHRFSIHKLFAEVIQAECICKTTRNSVVVTLTKKEQKNWDQLTFKENLLKQEKAPEMDKEDPQASLMKMMKEMYENGDDDMKRTIAQAWQKGAQDKEKLGTKM